MKNNRFYLKYAGFDYENLKNTYSYFNLCFYYLLERYINTNVNSLEYGGGSQEAKILRGCKITPLLGYFKLNKNSQILTEYIYSIEQYGDKKESYYNNLANKKL